MATTISQGNLIRQIDAFCKRKVISSITLPPHLISWSHRWQYVRVGGSNAFDEHFVEMEVTLPVAIVLRLCPAGPRHSRCDHHLCHRPILYFLMQEANRLTASRKASVSLNRYQTAYLRCDSLLPKWSIRVVGEDSSHGMACHWPGLFGS